MPYSPSDFSTDDYRAAMAGNPAMHGTTYADMVERLFWRYEGVLSLPDIVDVVRDCRRDLSGSPAGALPELTERLAWHRLADLVTARGRELPADG